ncbi:unnamed protein product [Choristocarpus tenellus]
MTQIASIGAGATGLEALGTGERPAIKGSTGGVITLGKEGVSPWPVSAPSYGPTTVPSRTEVGANGTAQTLGKRWYHRGGNGAGQVSGEESVRLFLLRGGSFPPGELTFAALNEILRAQVEVTPTVAKQLAKMGEFTVGEYYPPQMGGGKVIPPVHVHFRTWTLAIQMVLRHGMSLPLDLCARRVDLFTASLKSMADMLERYLMTHQGVLSSSTDAVRRAVLEAVDLDLGEFSLDLGNVASQVLARHPYNPPQLDEVPIVPPPKFKRTRALVAEDGRNLVRIMNISTLPTDSHGVGSKRRADAAELNDGLEVRISPAREPPAKTVGMQETSGAPPGACIEYWMGGNCSTLANGQACMFRHDTTRRQVMGPGRDARPTNNVPQPVGGVRFESEGMGRTGAPASWESGTRGGEVNSGQTFQGGVEGGAVTSFNRGGNFDNRDEGFNRDGRFTPSQQGAGAGGNVQGGGVYVGGRGSNRGENFQGGGYRGEGTYEGTEGYSGGYSAPPGNTTRGQDFSRPPTGGGGRRGPGSSGSQSNNMMSGRGGRVRR